MSIATPPERAERTDRAGRETCGHCGTTVVPGHTVRGSFCSQSCYYRKRGEGVINQIESDHQICSTCYGRVKTVEPAPETAPECADGFQFPTPRTTIGVDDFAREEYQRFEATRWSCECGAVDPGDTHAELQNVDLVETIANFYRALEHLNERGAIPKPPSKRRYFDALREHGRDAAYAAGRAVYG